MYQTVSDALQRAKAGEGPTLIEAITYRLLMHTTSDDPRKYRSEQEEKAQWEKEPIPRFKKYLENKGYWSDKNEQALLEEVRKEVEDAVKTFESMKDFKPDLNFDYVFGNKYDVIEEQRAEFLINLALEGYNG